MGTIILLLGLLGGILSLGFFIYSMIRKKPKKLGGIALAVSVIAIIIGAATASTPLQLSVDAVQLTTDAQGVATIEGEVSENAKITLDGKNIKNVKGTFSETVQLSDEKEHTYVLKASLNKVVKDEKIVVEPSKEFIAILQEEKKEKELLAKTETALALAESTPNQKNYDEAATLVHSLSKTYDDYDKRLKTIEENITIYEAVETAEKSLARKDLEEAVKQVALASLNKEELNDRVTSLQTKIEEKEEQEKLYAQAAKAVEAAEKSPSNSLCDTATTAIAKLPATDEGLTKRVAAVQQIVKDNEEKARKEKQEQEKKEQLAKAEQERQAAEQEQQAAIAQQEAEQAAANQAEEHVLVTATGSKYHTHKCGNGTYYDAPLSEALARGLTPCSKCY